ncbi:MAG: universal stress protein [Methyloprofundus sp.]|nr:universal stress protein [Methyloprofundus sp.]
MNNKVIACLDGSSMVASVADAGAWVSKTLSAPLTLVHVLDHEAQAHDQAAKNAETTPHQTSRMLAKLASIKDQQKLLSRERGQLVLDFAHDQIQQNHQIEAQKRLIEGELVDVLGDLSEETRVLIVGKRGESAAYEDLGGHLTKLIRASHRPTMVVTEPFTPPTKVLLAFDGSETMIKAINTVANSQLFKNLECHVVMVGAETDEHKEQLNWAENTLTENGLETQVQLLVETDLEKTLNQYAQKVGINMMVMGAYSHTRLRQIMMGSHTATLLRETDITLLILR